MGRELAHIKPFLASVPILYPLKTPGNQKGSGVFREYKMRVMAQNGSVKFIMQKMRTCLENFIVSFRRPSGGGGKV